MRMTTGGISGFGYAFFIYAGDVEVSIMTKVWQLSQFTGNTLRVFLMINKMLYIEQGWHHDNSSLIAGYSCQGLFCIKTDVFR